MPDDRTLTLKVEGRDYELSIVDDEDRFNLTPREWGIIKRLANVLPGELRRAIMGGDEELYIALAVIAMRRAGQRVTPDAEDRLLDTGGLVEVIVPEADAKEAPADPPAEAPTGADEASAENNGAAAPTTMIPGASGALS